MSRTKSSDPPGVSMTRIDDGSAPYTRIEARVSNPSISLRQLVTFSMFRMISALNPDTIESIDLFDGIGSPQYKIAVFRFRPILPTAGTEPCYMCMTIRRVEISPDTFEFVGWPCGADTIAATGSLAETVAALEQTHTKLLCTMSSTRVHMVDDSVLDIVYQFSMELDHPIGRTKYANRIIDTVMKRIFERLKSGVEQITL